MTAFIRRYTDEPTEAELLSIESVNVIDKDPPPQILGLGYGAVLLVGEFENGAFETPIEVTSPAERVSTFGLFGYQHADGTLYNNPCARKRLADNTLTPEYWNGNGHTALAGKAFNRLMLCRVDTSVGSVAFTRAASLTNTLAQSRYTLASTGLTLVLNYGGADDTATFTGVVAGITGAAAAFGTIVAGETLLLSYDGGATFTVTFLTGDTTIGNVVTRVNQYAGYTMASDSGGQLRLVGRQLGTGGRLVVVGGTGVTKCGHAAGSTSGTGNVANLAAVTGAEVKTIVELASAKATVDTLADGRIRITNDTDGGAGTILMQDTSTAATSFGFATEVTGTAVTGTAGIIPAGTVVQTSGANKFVTMQDITVTEASAGPYSVKVRHALDDGTGAGANVSTVTVIATPTSFSAFTVTNSLAVNGALSEAAIDAKYQTAIDATLDLNTSAKVVNIIVSARASNAIRRALKVNALNASASGLYGRMACIRPPLGTAKTVAQSTSVEPGVGLTRDQRVIYNWPGVRVKVDEIAAVGIAGGTGFTSDGVIDQGSDGWCASVISLLPPGENPGQVTAFMTKVLGLESSSNAANMTMQDYKNLRAAGICAPRIDGDVFFQSGVTSVDPTTSPNLVDIERRTITDNIEDSLAAFMKGYSKRKMTTARTTAMVTATRQYLNTFLGDTSGEGQRLDSFSIDLSGNTDALRSKGRYRQVIKAKTTPSFKSIELAVTAGPTVTIDETV
jgi:hypothetical protein